MELKPCLLCGFGSNWVLTDLLREQVELARWTEPSIHFLLFLAVGGQRARYLRSCREHRADALKETESQHGVVDHIMLFLAGMLYGWHVKDARQEFSRRGDRTLVVSVNVVVMLNWCLFQRGQTLFVTYCVVRCHKLITLRRDKIQRRRRVLSLRWNRRRECLSLEMQCAVYNCEDGCLELHRSILQL